MGWKVHIVICCLGVVQVLGQSPVGTAKDGTVEEKARKFVKKAEEELTKMTEKATFIDWNFASNLTDENEQKSLASKKVMDQLSLRLGQEAKKFKRSDISDRVLIRKLKQLSMIGISALPEKELNRYNTLDSQMQKIYSTAKVPSKDDPSKLLSLEPELSQIFAKSKDPKELEYYWKEWREQSGKKMRDHFMENIDLINHAARYGKDVVNEKGPIPAHLLGNMWAQSWNNLGSFLKPFPDKPAIDVTDAMFEQGWTPKIMFEKAEDFFLSMGLPPMREEFWNGSIIEKPDDGREMVCHASAWDFYNGKDFRINQCTIVTEEDFITVNHEMGHTQYQMSYANLSYLHRNGANAGFHEGVADILSLAVGTPSYYQRLGLMKDDVDITDKETNINLLFNTALQRLVFMPFGYLIDKYRWDMYGGWADKADMNCHWVKLRLDIQGVAPPVKRSEEDFDAGAKYHVAANIGYIRYFVAHIYEFQFYKELCEVSGQYDPNDPKKPLHLCNFYGKFYFVSFLSHFTTGSKEAGERLLSMISLGASKPWKEVIKHMTGSPKMDTGAFREYFRPLEKWLEEENRKNGVHVGWEVEDLEKYCQASSSGRISHNFGIFLPLALITLTASKSVFFV
eukprot:TCALIF_03835-PA protein Name:"Similar to Ance Angiotensin-converting enzyme (Drosophila melanogaster)" AED:0.12 eAED:0.12 QI:128/0.66/0.42/1/1/1/7/0/623